MLFAMFVSPIIEQSYVIDLASKIFMAKTESKDVFKQNNRHKGVFKDNI
jgi:hypothetical protein